MGRPVAVSQPGRLKPTSAERGGLRRLELVEGVLNEGRLRLRALLKPLLKPSLLLKPLQLLQPLLLRVDPPAWIAHPWGGEVRKRPRPILLEVVREFGERLLSHYALRVLRIVPDGLHFTVDDLSGRRGRDQVRRRLGFRRGGDDFGTGIRVGGRRCKGGGDGADADAGSDL